MSEPSRIGRHRKARSTNQGAGTKAGRRGFRGTVVSDGNGRVSWPAERPAPRRSR